jgi:hypothetical protein
MATGREGKEKNKEEKRYCLGMRLTSDSIERITYLRLVAATQIYEMKEYIHEFSNMIILIIFVRSPGLCPN